MTADVAPGKRVDYRLGRNRRVAGLRGSEVATLAAVSVEYYTRLERGAISGGRERGDAAVHLPPTYLVLTAGVTNAFLAGDLFNLFVSFEVLLVASYVLLTLGSTENRIRAGTTYVVVSLL